MTELARVRADIATLAREAKAVVDEQSQGGGADAAILYMSGITWGLSMAAKILDGDSADQALTVMEDALATVVGRMVLNGQLPTTQAEAGA